MKRFLICDKRPDFLHDVKMRAILDERECLITEVTDSSRLQEMDITDSRQKIILCENIIEDLPPDFLGKHSKNQILGYCCTKEGREKFSAKKIQCIGEVSSSAQLLSLLLGIPEDRADTEAEMEEDQSFTSWEKKVLQNHTEPAIKGSDSDVPQTRVSSIMELREARMKREAELLLKKEKEKDTKNETAISLVVTSTKGGVGKTTIATQLACCIALTSHGRGRFKACIVDFDTGFGDVCTALDYDLKGPTITLWLDDIRQRIKAGETKDQIVYTQEEIMGFLQRKEDTGLYALLAPQTHIDSLDVTADELSVIMRNLKENAGLDYIVYDTGNDLKDSTLLALDQAEYVLLVATQDISCAHCLDMFIRTMESIRFDMSKVRLVINNIMSAKATGISVAELQESFQYPCWAKIKHDPAIIRSNNFGKPVVFSATHDVTKQMRTIIQQLNEKDQQLDSVEPKRSIWRRMFSGKERK